MDYLLIHEDSSIEMTNNLTDDLLKASDAGVLTIVHMAVGAMLDTNREWEQIQQRE